MTKLETLSKLVQLRKAKLVNFSTIRVFNPDPSLWFDISIIDTLKIRVVSGTHPYFRSLDVGDLDEPGIQGLAFTRGFFKPLSLDFDLDRPMSPFDFVSQRVIVEDASVGILDIDGHEERARKILNRYHNDIIDFLRREYEKRVPFDLLGISTHHVGDDNILDFAFSTELNKKLYNDRPFPGAYIYIPL
jgi:hypothetical protein